MKLTAKRKRELGLDTSDLEAAFAGLLRTFGKDLPKPHREYKFHPERGWRLDFAWPDHLVGVEINGGTRGGASGHNTHAGLTRDYEKTGAAQLLGWIVLTFTGEQVNNYRTGVHVIEQVRRALKTGGATTDRTAGA